MEKEMRISVRELVAFTYFQEDILPAGSMMEAMHAGAKAHRARQADAQGETEKSIRHVFETDGLKILVFGRMDAFADGEIPFVEEIKLCGERPEAPLPEHRAQALIYAAMLSLEKPCAAVRFSVCYVSEAGEEIVSFAELQTAEELLASVSSLLRPFAAFAKRENEYRIRRDESLASLAFPFDAYRKGQRELAVQVYRAISRRKRLFASLPTGTGKSAAVLYPALKALGEGKTDKILYLTARSTARQSPVNTLERLAASGMRVRCSVLTAKEKLCPAPTRCHPDFCSRAKGHYLRQREAIHALLDSDEKCWDEALIRRLADAYQLCPFEFALSLTELADVVLMDLNYVFDPFAQVVRLAQHHRRATLLVDEAHHTVERVRESLSGGLDSRMLAQFRAAFGRAQGRKNPLYRSLSALISALRSVNAEAGRINELPEGLGQKADDVLAAALPYAGEDGVQDVIRMCLSFRYAREHLTEDYAILLEKHGKERQILLYCLLPAMEIRRITRGMRGAVFFSATLSPLPAMKALLGGEEEDACFSLPSPFPPENLRVLRRRINTRYDCREASAQQIADAVHEAVRLCPGNLIVFFPGYAYLELVRARLDAERLPELWVQQREMGEESREAFLKRFERTDQPCLALCVLGGLFSEGIDLPGERLMGVVIVGVGLPVPSARVQAVRDCYQHHFGDGFAYALRIPGMQKVLQAAGRVIRSETDRGMVMLLDDRYVQPEYEALLPAEWQLDDPLYEHAPENREKTNEET